MNNGKGSKDLIILCALKVMMHIHIQNYVKQGGGLCRTCAGKEWDVFYVIAKDTEVKLGITSGDPRPRLSDHQSAGFNRVLFMARNLDARLLETQMLRTLADNGHAPVRGNEYFAIEVLPVILSELDTYNLKSK